MKMKGLPASQPFLIASFHGWKWKGKREGGGLLVLPILSGRVGLSGPNYLLRVPPLDSVALEIISFQHMNIGRHIP